MDRRTFLTASAGAAMASAAQQGRFRKGICGIIFPDEMPMAERFRQARSAGFEGYEMRVGGEITLDSTPDQVKRIADEARRAGIEIVSLWASAPFADTPLNSPDAAVRARGIEALKKCIGFAGLLNCGGILLVPARVGAGPKFTVGYQDTWDRVTAELPKALPDAARAKVCLTLENVWNKFLLSPLEARSFVDQFRSPWLAFQFDTGNVMQWGYPQDWILTLGSRIKRVHVKDYKLSTRSEQGHFVDLLEGDVDWKEVMAALVKIGYLGFVSPEIGRDPTDPQKLQKVSRALDTILSYA